MFSSFLFKSHRDVIRVTAIKGSFLRTRLLLLVLEQSEQRHAGHLHHLETHSGNITDGVSFTSESCNEHLVVLVDKVEATVVRHERRDLLSVLDELHTRALTDSGVRLLRLDANLLQHDTLGVRASGERLGVLGTEVRLFVVLVGPELDTPVRSQLARRSYSSRLSHFWCILWGFEYV